MKRILVINTTSTSFNGISSVMMNYARKTYQHVSYDFILCGKVEEVFAAELKSMGRMVYISPYSRVKKLFKYLRWLRKILKEGKYDGIHVHGNSGTMYFEIHSAKKAGIPIRIAHSHNTSCNYKLAHKVLKPLLNKEITHAVACSNPAGKWLFKRDFTVLTNGIEISKFLYSEAIRSNYRELLDLKDKLVIGHVASMDTAKNHSYLLQVFKETLQHNENARLLLVGDGRLRGEIEEYIKSHDLTQSVFVLGKRADVDALYQCMDIFVLPSLYEGLPVTLVEAQASGLPCIISENITKEVDLTGKLQYVGIEDKDINKWVDCLLNTKTNSESRIKSSQSVSSSCFNIDNCVQNLYSLYGC